MKRILTTELQAHADERVLLQGWLHRKRELSRVTFLILRDRAGVARSSRRVTPCHKASGPETVLQIEGVAVANAQAPGGVEVHDPRSASWPRRPRCRRSSCTCRSRASRCRSGSPPHLSRSATRRCASASASLLARSPRSGARWTGSASPRSRRRRSSRRRPRAGEPVPRRHFGRDAFLAQSPQFYKQTLVGVFERVYEVGPVFRAEPHETARHLAEYVVARRRARLHRDHRDVMDIVRTAVVRDDRGGRREALPPDTPFVRFQDVHRGRAGPLA